MRDLQKMSAVPLTIKHVEDLCNQALTIMFGLYPKNWCSSAGPTQFSQLCERQGLLKDSQETLV